MNAKETSVWVINWEEKNTQEPLFKQAIKTDQLNKKTDTYFLFQPLKK